MMWGNCALILTNAVSLQCKDRLVGQWLTPGINQSVGRLSLVKIRLQELNSGVNRSIYSKVLPKIIEWSTSGLQGG